MSDTFDGASEASDRVSDAFDDTPGVSPWMLVFGLLMVVVLGLGVFLAVMVALQPDAKTAGEPQRPVIASEPMSNGSLLTLETVTYGTSHRFTFDRETPSRAIWPTSRVRAEVCSRTTAKDRIVVWFTCSHPGTGQALDFDWWLRCAAVDGDGCEIDNVDSGRNAYGRFGRTSGMSGGSGPFSPLGGGPYQMIVANFALPVFRHQGKTFKLRVYNTANVKVAEFDVPDPSPTGGRYPEWQPEELPITKSDGDVSLTLTGLTARSTEYTLTRNGISSTRTRVRLSTQIEIAQNGQPTSVWANTMYRLFDALGNESSTGDCKLCPKESAWKLQAKIWRSDKAEFAADEIWTLPKLTVPHNQVIEYINQSNQWESATLTLVALGGSGQVTYLGLLPGRQGGYHSRGTARFGQGEKRKNARYEIRIQNDQISIDGEVPHLLVQATGLTEDQHLAIRLSDEQGHAVPTNVRRQVLPTLYVCFFDVPPDVKKLHAELIVHECRRCEFLVKPPEIVPMPL